MHDPRLLRLSPKDNVLIAIASLPAGERLALPAETVTLPSPISLGFKVAARRIAAGEKIIKYGAPIGSATREIAAGDLVHVHNLKSDYLPTYTLEPGQAYVNTH